MGILRVSMFYQEINLFTTIQATVLAGTVDASNSHPVLLGFDNLSSLDVVVSERYLRHKPGKM